MAHSLGVCAVPLGLLMTGVNLADYLDEPSRLLHRNVALAACVVRLGIMPALMLCFARFLPCSVDLKRVLVVEAAMPAAVFPIIMARYYGGQPLTAVQVVLCDDGRGARRLPALDPRGLRVGRRRARLGICAENVPWWRDDPQRSSSPSWPRTLLALAARADDDPGCRDRAAARRRHQVRRR